MKEKARQNTGKNHSPLNKAEKLAFITGWLVGLAAGFIIFTHWFALLPSAFLAFIPATVLCFLAGFGVSWNRRQRERIELLKSGCSRQSSHAPHTRPQSPKSAEDLERELDAAVSASSRSRKA